MICGARTWCATRDDDDLFLSVLAIGELRRGLEQTRRCDLEAAERLETWIDGRLKIYDGQILPITAEIANRWEQLGVPNPIPAINGLLATTALVHDPTLVTLESGSRGRPGRIPHERQDGSCTLGFFLGRAGRA